MSSSSLQLLKGKAKDAVSQELEPDEVTINNVTMTPAKLETLIAENPELELSSDWEDLGFKEKVEWLTTNYDISGDDEEEAASETKAEPEKAEDAKETKAAKGKSTKSTKSTKAAKSEPATETAEDVKSDDTETAPATKTKATKGKAAKGKAVAKSDVKTGEIVEADVIKDMVHKIENLNENGAREYAKTLIEQSDQTVFLAGGVLSVIQENGWYDPYASFREFVEMEYGIEYRRAMYWVKIYNDLVQANVPWAKVANVGWTKLKEIAPIITEENVDEWVKIALENNTMSLIDLVKAHKAAAESPDQITGDAQASVTTSMSFKVHEGQREVIESAIEKAKETVSSDVATVALEAICLDYIGNPSLTERLKTAGIEKALEAVGAAFPDADISVAV